MGSKPLWSVIFCVLSAVIAACSLMGCALCVQRARAVSGSPGAPLRLLDSRVQSLSESLELTQTELERLANRVKMQKVRNTTEHSQRRAGELPDPYTSPDEWRAAVNRKLAQQRLGVSL